MSATLESLQTRCGQYLQDPGNLIFSAAALEECLRMALAETNLALGASFTVEGLDGAEATTLAVEHESLLVLGAAGMAAAGRGMRRGEVPALGTRLPEELIRWGEQHLVRFHVALKLARLDYRLAELAAAGAPYPVDDSLAGWRLDACDGKE